jgi:RHS repeat-associated protein
MTAVGGGRALRGLVVAVLMLLSGTSVVTAETPAEKPKRETPRDEAPTGTSPEAPEAPSASWAVDGRGGFSDVVEVAVPAFRAITPRLSLSYDSRGDNGWFGVGWGVDGISQVERVSPGRGAPRYDAADGYLIDGVELLPCAESAASPGCAAGGTHVTKTERYVRIALSGAGADSRWTVTAKDGVKRVFAPVHTAGADVFRWGLSEVSDASGNAVSYRWSGERLDSVVYNGTTVGFRYEERPDVDRSATGRGIAAIDGRVKTIDVRVGDSRLRAYRLEYTASGSTGRSLLSSVRQFGRDAVLDETGTVTGGTALPATTVGYRQTDPAFTPGTNSGGMSAIATTRFLPMDINGDGRGDILELHASGSYKRRSWISDGSGFTKASDDTGITYNVNARYLPADVTGDGKEDLVEVHPAGLRWGVRVWASTGTGFTRAFGITSHGGFNINNRFLPMDVNGDGRQDLLELYSCGLFPVHFCRATWLSTGTGFTLASHATGIPFSAERQFQPADVNGDGKSDLVELAAGTLGAGHRRLWLSTGTGFVAGAADSGISWTKPEADGSGSRFHMADVNGDGKTDMVELHPYWSTYTRRVWVSTGYGYSLASTDTAMTSVKTAKHLAIDVNGDDRVDMVEVAPYGFSARRRVWLSTGSGFTAGATDTAMSSYTCSEDGSCDTEFVETDIDGDGLTEMAELHPIPFQGRFKRVWGIDGDVPDVLASRRNEWGGTTSVTYVPSTAWENTGAPPIAQTATSVVVDDGRGGKSTTGYRYEGGKHDPAERRSLGFRSREETRPCDAGETACPTTETWYRQDLAALHEPERIERRGGDGALLASTVHEYAADADTLPRTALRTGTWEQVHTGPECPGAGCKREHTTKQHNAYGEVVRETEHGDTEATGDETTTIKTYTPNTSAYIVDKPASVKVVQGTEGALLGETRTHYDGAAWNQPPTAGLDTTTQRWLSETDSFATTAKEYDTWGNVTAEISATGSRKTTAYDPVHHLYPVTETNALAQSTTKQWDPVCGVPTRTTDLNAQASTLTHDALCRLVEKAEPGGRFERRSWVGLGDPAWQHERVERPGADGGGPHWSTRHIDGLQRVWRTVEKGPDSATGDIRVDTGYTARGHVATKTAAYYSGDAPQTTTYGYDPLDRLTTTEFPDGATQSRSYGLWSVTSTDELGRSHTDRFDARSRRIARQEAAGTTTYAYDPRGHLARSTDPLGNQIDYATDSLGRTTRMVDPNSGTWTYEHDAAGRMTAQTDGKGQRTVFAYDALDRRTARTTHSGTVRWTYDEARSGFSNTGKLTTTTDGAGSKTLDHDALGRVVRTVRTTGGEVYAFSQGFDAGDRPLWTTYPDGDTQGTAADPLRYDGAGRPLSIPGYVTAARYAADGKLIRLDNANGTVTTRPHDARRGWLTAVSTKHGATVIQGSEYTRDTKGMITRIASPFPEEKWTYTYDAADQLVSAVNGSNPALTQTMSYDAIGNITANSRLGGYTLGTSRPHAVTTAGAHSYTYDAAGLMTSGAGRTMTWDGDNRLASVTKAGVRTTFTYDADGERVQLSEGAITRHYVGDDFETTVGGEHTKYISIAGTLVARADGTTRHWLHTDHLGSIQAVTDAEGTEVHRKRYRPQGEIAESTGTPEPRGFAGQRHDSTGLLYLHARYYDPELGRFLSPDLIIDGEATIGLNRYAYAANNPVNNRDTTGLECRKSSDKGGGTCKDKGLFEGVVEAVARKAAEYKVDQLLKVTLKGVFKVKVIPLTNIITSFDAGWRAQSQEAANYAKPEIPDRNGFIRGLHRTSAFVTNFTWSFGDNLALNIPGTIKFGMDYGQWHNFGRAEGKPRPNVVVPILGQLTGCREGVLC